MSTIVNIESQRTWTVQGADHFPVVMNIVLKPKSPPEKIKRLQPDYDKIKSTQQGGELETRLQFKKALLEKMLNFQTGPVTTETWQAMAENVQEVVATHPAKK